MRNTTLRARWRLALRSEEQGNAPQHDHHEDSRNLLSFEDERTHGGGQRHCDYAEGSGALRHWSCRAGNGSHRDEGRRAPCQPRPPCRSLRCRSTCGTLRPSRISASRSASRCRWPSCPPHWPRPPRPRLRRRPARPIPLAVRPTQIASDWMEDGVAEMAHLAHAADAPNEEMSATLRVKHPCKGRAAHRNVAQGGEGHGQERGLLDAGRSGRRWWVPSAHRTSLTRSGRWTGRQEGQGQVPAPRAGRWRGAADAGRRSQWRRSRWTGW
jgi:hypothetical protein